LVASVVGAAYYLKIVYTMYFQTAQRTYPTNIWGFSPGATVALVISAIATLFFGVLPSGLYQTAVVGSRSLQAPPSVTAQNAAPSPAPVERASIR
jgi:NADH:ubiquinone oxidoreductase subunit 2 (subunit N)